MNHRHCNASARRSRGFSLIEMAVVLVIVGLLLSGMLTGMNALRTGQKEDGTRRDLDDIREALITFAILNRRLPCPAAPATANTVAGAGLERAPIAGGCTGGPAGVLPWATLGLPETDAWGRRYSYRVTPAFSRTAPAITLASVGDNTVQNLALVSIATQVPVVVVSHGENAAGSRNVQGAQAALGANAGEIENADADTIFTSDTPTAAFEDQVMWVPTTILVGRMLQAGTLP
jgi:prepilin-type N-terminal cleavage/methylation domain-containing protein